MATIDVRDDVLCYLEKETCLIGESSIDTESESDDHEESHSLRTQVTSQTNSFILSHWPFESDAARSSYLSRDLPGLACLCFPFALDERIHLIARLFSIVYLLGEIISELDGDDAEDCLQSLMQAVKGYWADRTQAEVWMLCDLFDEIRSHEYIMVEDIIEATWRYLELRTVRRGRRTKREDRRPGFQSTFVEAGVLLPLHRFATGLMIDEEEFNFGNQELLGSAVGS
ncbi:hypothetical protein CKM354_000954800 [Cercospora kikuchii]|uniref:Uncharacterized protein n=1 Tax=Cercospora kikuchii TaxID=84275 RepID=A0A9P3CNG6_9PEZI|nr:uncharacterized protein CKM354_000954800 [Cercospora kikuchii]GIZ46422.1 hypothetical protein CKM354_000954800 [Cercospora kikuchii]